MTNDLVISSPWKLLSSRYLRSRDQSMYSRQRAMLSGKRDGHIIGIDRNHLYAPCDNASPGSSSKVKRAQHQRKQQQLQIEREVCCRGLTMTYSYVRRWLCVGPSGGSSTSTRTSPVGLARQLRRNLPFLRSYAGPELKKARRYDRLGDRRDRKDQSTRICFR
jgi:hypothetical protein